VPLIIGERLLGLLDVQDAQPNRFVPSDVDVFSTLAGQIAIALENSHLFDELKSLDRLKSEFLASMSHELRTPLNSIIGYSDLILMGVNGPLNTEVTEDLHVIRDSGQHLLRIINNIIDYAKLESGRMVLEYQKVNLNALLYEIETEYLPFLQHRPVKLELEIDHDLPQIEADKQRLKQILMNLVSNAIKFTRQGFIRIHAFCEEESLILAVQDTGVGIHQSELTTIFEHFRQLDGSSTRQVEGSGLGLAITLHLVQLHGGTIKVESKLKKGSTFFLRLPIEQISHRDKPNHLKQFRTTF
jgi:signal transduction histidine kinase